MNHDDERDYAEEASNRADMEREALAELAAEVAGLTPEDIAELAEAHGKMTIEASQLRKGDVFYDRDLGFVTVAVVDATSDFPTIEVGLRVGKGRNERDGGEMFFDHCDMVKIDRPAKATAEEIEWARMYGAVSPRWQAELAAEVAGLTAEDM